MVSGISVALSGYNAAAARLDVSASNIANQTSTQTLGPAGQTANAPYVAQQVVQSAVLGGGVTTRTQSVAPPSVGQYDPSNPAANGQGIVQAPNVDPAQQIIGASAAQYDAQANVRVLEAQDDLAKQALNILT
jgi:flagellar basal-body rod protein FlgC